MSSQDTDGDHAQDGERVEAGQSSNSAQDESSRPRRQEQSTSYHSSVAPSSDRQSRPSNNVRQQQSQPSVSSASRTQSGVPSTSQAHTSYASFPSQNSLRAPSTASSQASNQPHIQNRAAPPPPPPPAPSTAPQGIRGYQNITSVEPAPKRPLWSLGSTLPRVRRLRVKSTKTAYPTPGSRSNIVQQPPTLVPMQPTRQRAGGSTVESTQAVSSVPTYSPGGPEELVHGHDYAGTTGDESYNAEGVAEGYVDGAELGTNLTTSNSTSAGAGDLPPIREGEPLPTDTVQEHANSHPAPMPSDMHARPRLDHSFSSPTAAGMGNIRVVDDDKLWTGHHAPQPSKQFEHSSQPKKVSFSPQDADSEDPQQRLSAARKQLMEEAKHGDGLLATQGSAVDANDYEAEDDESEGMKAAPSLGGVTSHPASKHIKTSSMPFLPSQGFDVLVAEPSHKGADQLNNEAQERKRSRAESQNRSAMNQTRHPGLSGAKPAPRGRAAGGPAAGVGIRKPSTHSTRRASNATNEDRNGPGYFNDDVPLHELTHLDRQGSQRYRRGSQQSHQTQEDHFEPRPVGGRSSSHTSSHGRDTRSAWLSHSMPSHASGRESREVGEGKRASLQQARQQEKRNSMGGSDGENRHSEETAYSSSADHSGEAGNASDQNSGGEEQGWEEEQKMYGGEEDMWLGGQGTFPDGSIAFPTTWSRWRYHSREFLAELLATMLLITVGTAVDCQVVLSQGMGSSAGSYPNQNWAWGIAVASTIYLSGGRSGAHCNPAITLALAVFRGFPWIQVPIYWSAQLLGSILGAAITYGIYLPAIDQFEGGKDIRTLSGEHGTGRLFVTMPQLVFTAASGFGTEVVATSILVAMVLAVGDETNAPPSDGLSALVLGFVVVMIGMSFGWPTSYAISPSRDLGPRLFLYMVGYGKELWTHNDFWWLYGPQAGCFTGGLLGALLYDLAIFTGEESSINYTKQGWKQSTPARLGSRLMNSKERLDFWIGPLRGVKRGDRTGHSDDDDAGDVGANEGEGERLGDMRSEDAVARTSSALNGRGEEGVGDGQGRRHSHASQQLDAQELGQSQSAFAGI